MSAERTRATSRAVAVLFLLFPAVATGFTLLDTTWTWQDHAFEDPIRLDTGEWPLVHGTANDVEARFTEAMDAWNDAGLDLTHAREQHLLLISRGAQGGVVVLGGVVAHAGADVGVVAAGRRTVLATPSAEVVGRELGVAEAERTPESARGGQDWQVLKAHRR